MFRLVLFSLAVGGCAPYWWREPTSYERILPDMGGGDLVLNLPIPAGDSALCVQGAYGTWSHDTVSTLHDLDLDTSNAEDQEVYAPIGGIARVHTESATKGFGYHVNIDLGDGSYVVLAHFKDVFISDLEEVGEGQLIGYEGCTGYCTGDHVHIGLHEGDAGLDADFGISVPVDYRTVDLHDTAFEQVINSDDFVCGIRTLGDPVDGHIYASTLDVPLWHPNGTLLKTPGNPMTHVLESGETRWITTEEVFWSLNYRFADVVLVSGEEFACYGNGPHIDALGSIEAGYDAQTGSLWLGYDGPDGTWRQLVQNTAQEEVLASWGLRFEDDPPVYDPEDPFFSRPVRESYAVFRDGAILKEESRSDVYVVSDGWAMPVADWNTYLLLGFGPREIIFVEDGAISDVQGKVGDCGLDIFCIDANAVTQCGGGQDLDDGFGGEGGPEDTGQEEEPEDEDPPTEGTKTESEDETDPPALGMLQVVWTMPFGWTADKITLSGEYIFADGTYGFTWRELLTVLDDDEIIYTLPGVGTDDTFRFSVEYTDDDVVSWSCIGPYPPGTRQGTARADVDGTDVTITETGDPSGLTDGCGLFLTVP